MNLYRPSSDVHGFAQKLALMLHVLIALGAGTVAVAVWALFAQGSPGVWVPVAIAAILGLLTASLGYMAFLQSEDLKNALLLEASSAAARQDTRSPDPDSRVAVGFGLAEPESYRPSPEPPASATGSTPDADWVGRLLEQVQGILHSDWQPLLAKQRSDLEEITRALGKTQDELVATTAELPLLKVDSAQIKTSLQNLTDRVNVAERELRSIAAYQASEIADHIREVQDDLGLVRSPIEECLGQHGVGLHKWINTVASRGAPGNFATLYDDLSHLIREIEAAPQYEPLETLGALWSDIDAVSSELQALAGWQGSEMTAGEALNAVSQLRHRVASLKESTSRLEQDPAKVGAALAEVRQKFVRALDREYRAITEKRSRIDMRTISQLGSAVGIVVHEIQPHNTKFDSRYHEVVSSTARSDLPAGTILSVYRMGYEDRDSGEITKAGVEVSSE